LAYAVPAFFSLVFYLALKRTDNFLPNWMMPEQYSFYRLSKTMMSAVALAAFRAPQRAFLAPLTGNA
jgi:hypothetical protein